MMRMNLRIIQKMIRKKRRKNKDDGKKKTSPAPAAEPKGKSDDKPKKADGADGTLGTEKLFKKRSKRNETDRRKIYGL